jgi:hypothetical protein
MYVKITNGEVEQYPYTLGDFRRDNPHTSFPKNIGKSLLDSYGIHRVILGTHPEYNPLVQSIVQDAQPVKEGDNWSVDHTVENKPQEEAEASMRIERDRLLSNTDWMALSDNTISGEWADYRQTLRDIPDQIGFPYDVTFPISPGNT